MPLCAGVLKSVMVAGGCMAWAARHRMYVRVRRGEMRLATVIVAEP